MLQKIESPLFGFFVFQRFSQRDFLGGLDFYQSLADLTFFLKGILTPGLYLHLPELFLRVKICRLEKYCK